MCFLSIKINWHTRTHTHSPTNTLPSPSPHFIFSLMFPITVSNSAAWHAYWNGNVAISKWNSFIHWLVSGFIHDNLLFTCRITLMRGLKGGACVCVTFLCFHAKDSRPGEKGAMFQPPPALSIIQEERSWFGFVPCSCSLVSTSCHFKDSGVFCWCDN